MEKLLYIMKNSMYNNISKSAAYANLDWLYKNLNVKIGNNSSIRHRNYLIYLISDLYEKD